MSQQIYIVEKAHVECTKFRCPEGFIFENKRSVFLHPMVEDIFPITKSDSSLKLCDKVRSYIRKFATNDKRREIYVELSTHYENYTQIGLVSRLQVCIKGPILDFIKESLGDSMRVIARFEMILNGSKSDLVTIGMKSTSTGNSSMANIFEDYCPDPRMGFSGQITCSIAVAFHEYSQPNQIAIQQSFQPGASDLFALTKKMLEDQVATDIVIAANNGTEFPCHKAFLTASSDVFETMLHSKNFKEAKTKRIKVDDMSEAAVKAFLAFLYYLDVAEAVNDYEIALELLYASEKYSVNTLKNAMKKIILAQNTNWFKATGAAELFLFARNVEDCSDLKDKAVTLLKTNVNGTANDYKVLLAKHSHEAAIDLCSVLISTQKI